MPADDPDVEILAQEVAVTGEKARSLIEGRPLARLRGLVTDREVARTELRYKPYYAFDAVLTRRVFAGEDIVHEGSIVVDALSGISRPLLDEHVDLTETRAPRSSLLSADLDESEALREAKSRRMQVEHRERGEVEMEEAPRTVYKPVWLVELTDGDVQVVDATNGQVVGDLVFG